MDKYVVEMNLKVTTEALDIKSVIDRALDFVESGGTCVYDVPAISVYRVDEWPND